MRYLWWLFSHFITSNSRHGTHSPFVYKLADEVIYVKTKRGKANTGRRGLLLDIATYLGVTYSKNALEEGVDKALIVRDSLLDVDELALQVRQFKYLVVPSIYKNKQRKRYWRAICKDARFIVCIDLFYYGLVFYRHQQQKEIFKLRYPYWR